MACRTVRPAIRHVADVEASLLQCQYLPELPAWLVCQVFSTTAVPVAAFNARPRLVVAALRRWLVKAIRRPKSRRGEGGGRSVSFSGSKVV